MTFQPEVGSELHIEGVVYRVSANPQVPWVPYGQEGRQAVVYQLVTQTGERRALKVFKFRFRLPVLVSLTDKIAPFARLPALQVCKRTVLTARRHRELLRSHPDLVYAVLMPWVEGPTWMQVMGERAELSPERSLMLARGLVDILVCMEETGLAHCDLSGSNVMLPMLAGGKGLELVDVEQVFAPGLQRPEPSPGGSPGYAHKSAFDGTWGRSADRFAGAVLLAEMLGWCNERIREASWGESYFATQEMGKENERFDILRTALREHWGHPVASLFERAWRSEALADCPTFGDWLVAIPPEVPEALPHRNGVGSQPTETATQEPTQQLAQHPREEQLLDGDEEELGDLAHLFDDALEAYEERSWAEAKELLAEVVRVDPDYHRSDRSAAELLGKVQAQERSTDQDTEETRQPIGTLAGRAVGAITLAGVVGAVVLGAVWFGWRQHRGPFAFMFSTLTPTPAVTRAARVTPESDPTPTVTPTASITPAPRTSKAPTASATLGATSTPRVTDTPSPTPTPTDVPTAPSALRSPLSPPAPAASGWISFSALYYCVGDECRRMQNGSIVSRSGGEIRWQMQLLAPDLNEADDDGRYYIGREIGLRIVSGGQLAYVQPFAGQTICSQGSGHSWRFRFSDYGDTCSRHWRVLSEVLVDVRNLPEWTLDNMEIAPAAMVSRRDYVGGNWSEEVDAHWELGAGIQIILSD